MPEFKFDKKQELILDELKEFAKQLGRKSFFRPFNTNSFEKKGIYLYGKVGNGKTMLMQYFYQMLSNKKLMVHYQQFIQSVHKDLHQFQNKLESKHNILTRIAISYAKKCSAICIDEFEVKDITDAMIIGPLLLALINQKIFIFITSNTKPDNLYQDGLQRGSFLPVIKEINQKFAVLYLDSDHDYRLDQVIKRSSKRIIYPVDYDNKLKMQKLIAELSKNMPLAPINLEIFGRLIFFQTANQKMLVTSGIELFKRQLSYVDYVNICQKFSIIVVEDVPVIETENTDLAVRFINFIDNAYFYKVMLFMTLETEPDKIYENGHRSDEFKRTISRLYEMNSDSYVNH